MRSLGVLCDEFGVVFARIGHVQLLLLFCGFEDYSGCMNNRKSRYLPFLGFMS